jgi:hypothetical protein
LLLQRVGIECAPLGGPAAMVPAESCPHASWTWFVTVVFIVAEQMAPGEMEPLQV